MANKAVFELSKSQQDTLNDMPLAFLITFDELKRWPITHAISWVQAPDEKTVRFTLTKNSHLVTLLANERTASLIFIEGGQAYSVALSHVSEFEPSVKPGLHLRFFEGDVEEVRNISFYGATFGQPEIVKTYDVEAANRLDREVKKSLNS